MRIWQGVYRQQEFLEQRSQLAKEQVERSLTQADARPVEVAVCQLGNHCDGADGKQRNLDRMLHAIETARQHDAQVIVFPEMCLPGYFVQEHGTPALAVAHASALSDVLGESSFLAALQNAAGSAETVLTFGFAERQGDSIYNAVGVVDSDGTWIGLRRKNPLSPGPYDLEPFVEPPASERSAVFQTGCATIGVSNCFDGEFPESVRRMRLEGAELLLWSNAATGDSRLGSSTRFSQCGSYAQTNRMWVASSNAVSGNCYGNSCIYAPWGEPLIQLPHDEEALGVATINLALSTDWSPWHDRLDFSGLGTNRADSAHLLSLR